MQRLTFLCLYFIVIICLPCSNSFGTSLGQNEQRKTMIVTCATGALGSTTARNLARDYDLILTGRNVAVLKQLQKELTEQYSCNCEICILDYTIRNSLGPFNELLNRHHSKISGMVLIFPRPQFYGKELFQEEAAWLETIQLTFTGPLETLKAVIPHLSRDSSIVVISGTTSVQMIPETGPSCVIRRMWTTYTKALSHQLGPQGIRVNALSPGVILTNFHEDRIQKAAKASGLSYEDQMTKDVAKIPLQRHAQPEELAKTVRFLLSNESSFINGANLVLDGGLTVTY